LVLSAFAFLSLPFDIADFLFGCVSGHRHGNN
jgi:hypothetical protein